MFGIKNSLIFVVLNSSKNLIMELKIVYYVTTSAQRWGKGLTLATAMEAAGLNRLKKGYVTGSVEASVYFAVFKKETTTEELENLKHCITADEVYGSPIFYEDTKNPAYDADQEMINRLFLGWISDHVSFRAPKKEKQHS